jgi:hypothetical protein
MTMADDLQNRGPQDRSRINISEDWELRWWAKSLGVSESDLRKAVLAVGSSAEKVRQHLGK